MTTVLDGIDAVRARVGDHLGYSEHHDITQERVNLFADATGDHQWIHVDVERARGGPFGGPIAHGFLTLSLIPALVPEVLRVDGLKMSVNYGLNKVRFPSPVPVGSRIRLGVRLLAADDVANGGLQTTYEYTIEVEGGTKPACVAEGLVRYAF